MDNPEKFTTTLPVDIYPSILIENPQETLGKTIITRSSTAIYFIYEPHVEGNTMIPPVAMKLELPSDNRELSIVTGIARQPFDYTNFTKDGDKSTYRLLEKEGFQLRTGFSQISDILRKKKNDYKPADHFSIEKTVDWINKNPEDISINQDLIPFISIQVKALNHSILEAQTGKIYSLKQAYAQDFSSFVQLLNAFTSQPEMIEVMPLKDDSRGWHYLRVNLPNTRKNGNVLIIKFPDSAEMQARNIVFQMRTFEQSSVRDTAYRFPALAWVFTKSNTLDLRGGMTNPQEDQPSMLNNYVQLFALPGGNNISNLWLDHFAKYLGKAQSSGQTSQNIIEETLPVLDIQRRKVVKSTSASAEKEKPSEKQQTLEKIVTSLQELLQDNIIPHTQSLAKPPIVFQQELENLSGILTHVVSFTQHENVFILQNELHENLVTIHLEEDNYHFPSQRNKLTLTYGNNQAVEIKTLAKNSSRRDIIPNSDALDNQIEQTSLNIKVTAKKNHNIPLTDIKNQSIIDKYKDILSLFHRLSTP